MLIIMLISGNAFAPLKVLKEIHIILDSNDTYANLGEHNSVEIECTSTDYQTNEHTKVFFFSKYPFNSLFSLIE